MTLVERLLELRLHLAHLEELRGTIADARQLEGDISLRNDVLHSLQTVCQIVIDIAGELSARHGLPFQDYTEAVRNLARIGPFPGDLVEALEPLPAFLNVVIHDYVALELARALEALDELGPVEQFAAIVARVAEDDR